MISDILYYTVHGDFIYVVKYKSKDVILISALDNSRKKLCSNLNIVSNLFVRGRQIILCHEKEHNFVIESFDLDSGKISFLSDFALTNVVNGKLLYGSGLKDGEQFSILKSIDKSYEKYFSRNDFWMKYSNDEYLYGTNLYPENEIFKRSISDDQRIWIIEDTKGYNTFQDDQNFVTSVDGWTLIDGVLYVPLRNGKILVINDDKGEVERVIFSDNPNGKYGNYYHDPFNNKLVKLFRDTLHEVDLITQEVSFFEISELKSKDKEPNGGKWAQNKNYIYYCSFDGSALNAFNKETKEIDWQYTNDLNPENIDLKNEIPVRFSSVRYHSGRLFLSDNKRNLRIIDKGEFPDRGKQSI